MCHTVVIEVFEGCGLVQYACDERQALLIHNIIIREMRTLNAVQNHNGFICEAISPLEQLLHRTHILALFFKSHEEGHHMCGLACVTT
ncbi:hypothetical protein ACSQ67_015590 [Phaseolus vulgaris]